jgi:hypothetical protein
MSASVAAVTPIVPRLQRYDGLRVCRTVFRVLRRHVGIVQRLRLLLLSRRARCVKVPRSVCSAAVAVPWASLWRHCVRATGSSARYWRRGGGRSRGGSARTTATTSRGSFGERVYGGESCAARDGGSRIASRVVSRVPSRRRRSLDASVCAPCGRGAALSPPWWITAVLPAPSSRRCLPRSPPLHCRLCPCPRLFPPSFRFVVVANRDVPRALRSRALAHSCASLAGY